MTTERHVWVTADGAADVEVCACGQDLDLCGRREHCPRCGTSLVRGARPRVVVAA